MSRAAYREVIRAVFLGDFDRADRLGEEIGDVSWQDSGMLVAAVFSLAVKGRFVEGANDDEVAAFVREARSVVSDPDGTLAPIVNAIVRAALGDEHLLDGVPPTVGMRLQLTIIRLIFAQAEADAAAIDSILDQAEKLLDESIEADAA